MFRAPGSFCCVGHPAMRARKALGDMLKSPMTQIAASGYSCLPLRIASTIPLSHRSLFVASWCRYTEMISSCALAVGWTLVTDTNSLDMAARGSGETDEVAMVSLPFPERGVLTRLPALALIVMDTGVAENVTWSLRCPSRSERGCGLTRFMSSLNSAFSSAREKYSVGLLERVSSRRTTCGALIPDWDSHAVCSCVTRSPRLLCSRPFMFQAQILSVNFVGGLLRFLSPVAVGIVRDVGSSSPFPSCGFGG